MKGASEAGSVAGSAVDEEEAGFPRSRRSLSGPYSRNASPVCMAGGFIEEQRHCWGTRTCLLPLPFHREGARGGYLGARGGNGQ